MRPEEIGQPMEVEVVQKEVSMETELFPSELAVPMEPRDETVPGIVM